jgi:hypothetical protein
LEINSLPQSTSGSQTEQPDIAIVRDLVGYLYKAVKTILLYPPSNPLPGEFKVNLHDKLSKFTDAHGPLTLSVRGDQFVYDGHTVHEEKGGDDNFIATLTRDGVQKLGFHPDLDLEELDRFLGIIKRVINDRCDDDDLVTLLWESSFEHIRYEAISELDNIDYEALEQNLRARRPTEEPGNIDYGAIVFEENEPAGAAPESSPKTLEAVDVSAIIDDLTDLSDDLSQVDNYLKEATQFDAATSTIGIVFEIMIAEEEVPAFGETCNILDSLYDRFMEQADFGSAAKIYEGVCELEQAELDHSPARAKRLAQSRMRTADKLRIDQLTAALNNNPGCDIHACQALLTGLPIEILAHLVAALGDLEHYPSRKAVCDVLAERGADRIDTIGNGIYDKRWYVVRNVAIVLGNIGGNRACQYLQKAVQHDDDRVRREVIEALVRMDPTVANPLLRSALNDTSVELRLASLRALAHRGDEKTAHMASDHIMSKNFLRLEPTEQKEWLGAVALLMGDHALPMFRKLISSWAVIDRTAKLRLKGLAVVALGESGGPETTMYLEKLAENRNQRISDAASRALQRLKNEHPGAR